MSIKKVCFYTCRNSNGITGGPFPKDGSSSNHIATKPFIPGNGTANIFGHRRKGTADSIDIGSLTTHRRNGTAESVYFDIQSIQSLKSDDFATAPTTPDDGSVTQPPTFLPPPHLNQAVTNTLSNPSALTARPQSSTDPATNEQLTRIQPNSPDLDCQFSHELQALLIQPSSPSTNPVSNKSDEPTRVSLAINPVRLDPNRTISLDETVDSVQDDVVTVQPTNATTISSISKSDQWVKWMHITELKDESDGTDRVLCCSDLPRFKTDQVDLCSQGWFTSSQGAKEESESCDCHSVLTKIGRMCWKACFVTVCLPFCYPCYLSRSLRRLLPSRRVFQHPTNLNVNGQSSYKASQNIYNQAAEGLSKALRTRLAVPDRKSKEEFKESSPESVKSKKSKHVIHVNVIILNNSCDKSLCELVNNVLSKKEEQMIRCTTEESSAKRRSGLATEQFKSDRSHESFTVPEIALQRLASLSEDAVDSANGSDKNYLNLPTRRSKKRTSLPSSRKSARVELGTLLEVSEDETSSPSSKSRHMPENGSQTSQANSPELDNKLDHELQALLPAPSPHDPLSTTSEPPTRMPSGTEFTTVKEVSDLEMASSCKDIREESDNIVPMLKENQKDTNGSGSQTTAVESDQLQDRNARDTGGLSKRSSSNPARRKWQSSTRRISSLRGFRSSFNRNSLQQDPSSVPSGGDSPLGQQQQPTQTQPSPAVRKKSFRVISFIKRRSSNMPQNCDEATQLGSVG